MNEEETATFLVWVNQYDPYVQMNDVAARIWHGSMKDLTVQEAEDAVIQHYRLNVGKPAEPATIRIRALNQRASTQAKRAARAITGPPQPAKTHGDYLSRVKSPEFIALFEEGRRQGNAMRARATAAREGRHGV